MHELSIAESIADAVRRQPAVRDGRRVTRIGVRVGATSGVNADALAFCFEIAIRESDLQGAALDVEPVPVRYRCDSCGHQFEPVDFDPRCPSCGDDRGRLVGGDELTLSYVELLEHEG